MEKAKQIRVLSHSQLRYISEMQMEECLQRLQALDDEALDITIDVENLAGVEFEIDYRRDGDVVARAKGTLRRWQGTQTRVDCDGHTINNTLLQQWRVQMMAAGGIFAALVGLMLLYVTFGYVIIYDWEGALRCFLPPIFMIAVGAFATSRVFIEQHYRRRDLQNQRDLNRLMQLIVDTLPGTVHEVVEHGDLKNPLFQTEK